MAHHDPSPASPGSVPPVASAPVAASVPAAPAAVYRRSIVRGLAIASLCFALALCALGLLVVVIHSYLTYQRPLHEQVLADLKELKAARNQPAKAVTDPVELERAKVMRELTEALNKSTEENANMRKVLEDLGAKLPDSKMAPAPVHQPVEASAPAIAPTTVQRTSVSKNARQVVSQKYLDKPDKPPLTGSPREYEVLAGQESIPFCHKDYLDTGRLYVSPKKGLRIRVYPAGLVSMSRWFGDGELVSVSEGDGPIVVPPGSKVKFSWVQADPSDKEPLIIKVWN